MIMKKLVLPLFMLCGLLLIQTPKARAQGFGLKAGVNMATFNYTQNSPDSRIGVMAGLTYDFAVPMSPVTIQPGVFYTQKGAKTTDGSVETTTKLDYIEIPVLAKFNFILDNPVVTPKVYFGPYMGFTFNAKAEASGDNVSGSVNIDDQVKGTDFGVVVGGGVDINQFNVGLRYSAGLTDVAENNAFNGKNGVFSIVAGVNF